MKGGDGPYIKCNEKERNENVSMHEKNFKLGTNRILICNFAATNDKFGGGCFCIVFALNETSPENQTASEFTATKAHCDLWKSP